MLYRLKQHIQSNIPHLNSQKIIVAISGGLDSVVLTHLLYKMDYKIALAHVNYQLRSEESDLDENFVKKLGNQLEVPVFVHKAYTNTYAKEKNLSIQMAAREIRYDWFDELLQKHDYEFVLTAHHLDDSIETFFINLNRSTGLEGLTGIPPQNGKIIRPLLTFSRTEIKNFAIKNKLEWREDASNATNKYERNKIRLQLLPVLQEINPNFKDAFATTQSYLKGSQALIDDYIAVLKTIFWKETDTMVTISVNELSNLSSPKAVLFELLKGYGFSAWEDIFQLMEAQSGKQVLSKTHVLLKDREFLVLSTIEEETLENKDEKQQIASEFSIENKSFEMLTLSEKPNFVTSNPNEVFFDKNKVSFPLFVRKWQKGDYFYPLGMKGKKKLSDFLIDIKISKLEKEKIWLLCDAKDQIIWIVGKRLDNRFKITDKTTEIIKILPSDEKNS